MQRFNVSAWGAGAWTVAATLGFSSAAMATCAPSPINNDCTSVRELTFTTPPRVFVAAVTAENSSGGWDYQYTLSVDNTSQLPYRITNWLLPVASDAQISQLQALAYNTSGTNDPLAAVRTEAGLSFNIPWPYPLDMPGKDRLLDLAQISFHSPFAPDASAATAITLTGTTTTRTYNSFGVNVTETRIGITPATPSLVSVAMPGSPMALSPVPEPSAGAMLGLGLGCLPLLNRARRKKPLQAGA